MNRMSELRGKQFMHQQIPMLPQMQANILSWGWFVSISLMDLVLFIVIPAILYTVHFHSEVVR